jgi:phosphatidylglycerol:prolipoprotein diacylglycerol transferase
MRLYFVDLLNALSGTKIFAYIVPNYAVMLALGFLFGTIWTAREAKRTGLDAAIIYRLALWVLPMAILGGRLIHVIYSSREYSNILGFIDPAQGDNVAYGGFIAGTVTCFIYLIRRRLSLWRYLDCAVIGVGIGTFLTRIGCFLNGDDYGTLTTSFLGVTYPAGSYAYMDHVRSGLLSPSALHSLPVHPVQLYLSVNGLILAAAAAYWNRSGSAVAGETFSLYWLLYAMSRFVLEYLRGDESRGFIGPFSTSQAISLPVALISACLIWYLRYRAGKKFRLSP